jgi:hypothetical protein
MSEGLREPPLYTLFTMESAAALTVADLRSRAITNWVQNVMLHVPFQRGPPMEVHLNGGTVLPKVLFEYQLSKAVYQGTAAGGVRWWFKQREAPTGASRQHGFDISVRYDCRHGRRQYKKRATTDSRRSKHAACVDCPAFVRFKGSVATDCQDGLQMRRWLCSCGSTLVHGRFNAQTVTNSKESDFVGRIMCSQQRN